MSALIVGGAQTLSKMRARFPGAYPRSLVAGRGARATDGGRDYIDWIAGLGAVSLGYGNAAVNRAVYDQVSRGPIFSLPDAELEERVAQRLVDLIPCAASVRFVKSGSEATEAAIRVARAATGRDVVLACGYHGWHSWYAATREDHPGVPEPMTRLVRTFPYNDANALEQLLHDSVEHRDGLTPAAAVILEPTLIEAPAPGFLAEIKQLCAMYGAILIFDEMVTGFRWHAGGAQTLYGLTPDLATFGKGMGNGYPIAALVGREDLMRQAMLVSGTFGGDCIGLAAADATLARYQQGGVCEHMARIGRLLIDGYNALAAKHGAPTRMVGQPPHPAIRWDEEHELTLSDTTGEVRDPGPNRHRASLFFQETVKRGALFHPEGINIMLAHTEADVEATLNACDEAMALTMAAIKANRVRESIEGDSIDPAPAWRATR